MRHSPVIILILSGCGILGPDLDILNHRLLDPIPPEYPRWYAEVESCLGRTGDFDAISWYVADDIIVDGIRKGGRIEFPNRITMRAPHVYRTPLVKHEMVHHILQAGGAIHDTPVFDCA